MDKKFLHCYHDKGLLSVVRPTKVFAVRGTIENWLITYNYVDDEILLNMTFYETAILGIDKPNGFFEKIDNEPLTESKKNRAGVFLLVQDGRNNNSILHSTPNYIMVDKYHRLFFNFSEALDFANYLAEGPNGKTGFSIYQFLFYQNRIKADY